MTLVSGDLFIMSFNIIFVRFGEKSIIILAIYLFHYLPLLKHWYTFFLLRIAQFLLWLLGGSEIYVMQNDKKYLHFQCICLFLFIMHLINPI